MNTIDLAVEIRGGYVDSALGNIGGWEVIVVRSFLVNDVKYFDTEVTARSLSAMSEEVKRQYFRKKIVFTRIRIAQSDTLQSETEEPPQKRDQANRQVQRDWFAAVGAGEADPTKVASDDEDDGSYDEGRRSAIKAMAAIGIGLLLVSLSECNDCNGTNSGGSWGRSGGGYYG